MLVAAGLSLFSHLVDACFDGFEVLQLQLIVDDFLVAHRVDVAVNVSDVVVVEAAQHMNDGICFADVSQELVAQAFALRRALHQAGNVNNLHRSGDNALRIAYLSQLVESLVGHGYHADVWFDGAKWEISRLRLSVRQTVEKR